MKENSNIQIQHLHMGGIRMIKNTLIETLGIEITHIEPGKVIATMPVDERTRQPFGFYMGVLLLP